MIKDHPIDWCIFCGYLAVVFGLGLWFAGRQRDNEEYFVGGRRMNWFAVGVSLFATAFSSLSFVALPREAAYEDYHLLVTYLFIPLVITPVLWWVFVPLYLRLGVTSVYEYLEIRFNRAMRRFGTVLFALYAIGWMGAMVYAVGLILKAVLDLGDWQFIWTLIAVGLFATLYTTLGGVRAVIWTDVLQAATLGGGMLLVLLLTLREVDGGWMAVIELGRERGKFEMFDMDLDFNRRATFFSACALGLFVYLSGYTVSQVTVQRYLCTPSLKDARRALAINAGVATIVALLFFFAGSALFAYYHQPSGPVGGEGFPDLDQTDQLLPHFVLHELRRPGLTGLLIAGLFAAVMSTIDSGINSLTAVVVYDWLSGRRLPVRMSRLLCAGFGICVVAAALVASQLERYVIDIIFLVAGVFLGLLMAVFLLGMLVPRANALGTLIGLLAGVGCFVFVKTQTDVKSWWYGVYTCLPTLGVGTLASYLFAPPRPDQSRGLVWRSARR